MRVRTIALYVCASGAALFLLGCEPPGKPAAHPAQAENREDISDFKTLYQSNCSGCHGDSGQQGPARILNDALYLSIMPRQELENVIRNGRPGTQMPSWSRKQGGPLTDKQIEILVDSIYSDWGKGMQAPANAPAYAGTAAGDAGHGKQLFLRDCFMCHAKGMNPGPITTSDYLQLASNQMLRTSIIVGRPDLGMPSYQFLNMGRPLSNQDVTDLVAYLNSQRMIPAPEELSARAGETASGTGAHENENGNGQQGPIVKGNEGSGFGPGSPTQHSHEGNKGKGSESERGIK